MKVGIIQNVTLNDHRSVYSHNVACGLVKKGIDVDVILQKTEEELQYKLRPYNLIQIPGKTYSIPGQIRFITSSFAILKKGHYDIIHAKNPFSSVFPALVLRKVTPSAVVYDMRGLWIDFGVMSGKIPPYLGPILKKMESFLLKRCDHLIVISPALKEVLVSRGFEKEKISVIFGDGVDIKKIELVSAAKKEKGVRTIGYVGTISTARQSEKIIEAFQKIGREDVRLVMIGPVGEPHIFEKLTLKSKNVVLTGFLPQEKAFQLLKSFDVVVSYHEVDDPVYHVAVPTKIFEYMACGVPIVTTDHQMYKNILEDKKTAVLTQKNPDDFARGITYVLDHVEEAEKMAKRARVNVENYSIEKVVDSVEAVYQLLT